MKTFIFILFLSLWSPIIGLSQSFTKDIAAINYSYLKLNKKMSLTSTMVKSNGEKSANTIEVAMKGIDNYFMKGSNSEILVKDGIKISVNHDLKVIMVDSNKTDSKEDLPIQLFDYLPKFYEDITFSKTAGLDKYTLKPKIGPSRLIELQFNRKDMLLYKLNVNLFDFKTQQEYTLENNYFYSGLIAGDIPSVKFYFNVALNTVNPNFSTYSLINQLNY